MNMKARLVPAGHVVLAGLLGAALLAAAPAAAQAAQGKWWKPKQEARGAGWHRGQQRVWRQVPGYGRYYRDRVIIYDGYRGPRYNAYRYWVEPSYRAQYVYVRPVRYMFQAHAIIGGVSISAGYRGGEGYGYGCSFCDARFDAYSDWAVHVGHCGHAPHGYVVRACPWDDNLDRYGDSGWHEDGDRDYYDR
jgi:hypothetical protein